MAANDGKASRSAVVALVVAGLALTGCRSDGQTSSGGPAAIDRAAFTARVVEREKMTEQQARCVTGYVYDGYDAADIAVIYEQEFTVLPSIKWGEYGHALAACGLHDELIPGTTAAPSAPAGR